MSVNTYRFSFRLSICKGLVSGSTMASGFSVPRDLGKAPADGISTLFTASFLVERLQH